MKNFLVLLALVTGAASAQDVYLSDYGRNVQDIRMSGYTKEDLYNSLNTNLVKTSSSICSNRALIWNYDLSRHQRVDSAKMFLFYTGKNGRVGRKTWWYHVTPVVNEGGQLFTIDAGFPGWIDTPLSIADWLHQFVGTSQCKEIRAGENDLIENMYSERIFPQHTRYGSYDCYYIVVPKEYWTPETVADQLLGKTQARMSFQRGELQQSCVEAATGGLGGIFGGNKKKCQKYLGFAY